MPLWAESRIHGDVYVRFGGRLSETYHRKVAWRRQPSLLSVRTQNELAFFRNIVGMDSVEKKEGYSSWRGTAFLDI